MQWGQSRQAGPVVTGGLLLSLLVHPLTAEVDAAAQALQEPEEPEEPEVTIEIDWGTAQQQLFLETSGRHACAPPAVTNRLSIFIGRVRSETGHLQRAMTEMLCIFCKDSCLWARMWKFGLGPGIVEYSPGGWTEGRVGLVSCTHSLQDAWTNWLQ